jgi:c-di-GMP-binding flagellar brake protein YcgR
MGEATVIQTDEDVDRPDTGTQADVTLVLRGTTVTVQVTKSDESGLIVIPAVTGPTWNDAVKPGDPVEIYWVQESEELRLPARVASTDTSAEPRWQLRPTGPAEKSQRRKVVRAKVELPVVAPWAGGQLKGTTIDLSEGGTKVLVDGWGLPPDPDTPLPVTLTLEDGVALDVQGEVVWTSARGTKQWVVAVRFPDVTERDADTLRRRVFAALREERARANA